MILLRKVEQYTIMKMTRKSTRESESIFYN